MTTNPFLKSFNTAFDTLPFDQIEVAHYLPAIEIGLQTAQKEIADIVDNPEPPNFENTIEALELSGNLMGKVSTCLFNLFSAETNDALQAVAQQISPMLAAHSNDVLLNAALFARVQTVWGQRDQITDSESRTLIEKTYKAFVRNGAMLDDAAKVRLRAIDAELSGLSLTFAQHVLADSQAFMMHLTDEADLEGLPESVVAAAAEEAASRELSGWVITLDMPSYLPFMTYSKRRDLREKMFRAYNVRGNQDNENNNVATIFRLVSLRQERAALLGYESHAAYVLEERMAQSADTVLSFLEDLNKAARKAGQRELEEMQEYAIANEGISQVQRWDSAYLSEKMKQQRFGIDDEMLKPYFQLEKVVAGIFEVARRLYNLKFIPRADIPKYHPDVQTYEVLDGDGRHLAVYYADYFPRKGKRNGAWMTSYRSQRKVGNQQERPHISIVCNFTKPTAKTPSLLTFQEVTTLFHEFGHALHGMLADTRYASLSGTSVYWDFVELPSQIMENWCYEKACLDIFAKHYDTGAAIPMVLVDKIKESSTFMAGMATLRQIGLGRLDMAWHNGPLPSAATLESVERAATKSTDLLPPVVGTSTSTAFGHIFQGSYAAGYYSYKWAEVLDADAFEYFLETGIFNAQTAGAFRKLLASGGTRHPMDLYVAFRGRQPDPKALLRRSGLMPQEVQ
jgi:peptidyl-dipeptidase Dcp